MTSRTPRKVSAAGIIKDLHTCEIVGYALGKRMTKELVARALFGAVAHKRSPPGLIHHSDCGSQ